MPGIDDPSDLHVFHRHLDLDDGDLGNLRRLGGVLTPHLPAVVEAFYRRIEAHPEAMERFPGGADQLARQRSALTRWLEELFLIETWEEFVERNARVGAVHVNADVHEWLMIAAMSWLRRDLTTQLEHAGLPEGMTSESARKALDGFLDFGLGIMLNVYWRDLHRRLTRADRLALIGQFTASINHELRNPLAVIRSSAYLLRDMVDGENPGARKQLDRIDSQLGRAHDIISGMLRLLRSREPERKTVRLREFLAEAVEAVPCPSSVEVELDVDRGDVCGSFDPVQMRQAVENLVRNAIEAVSGEGRVVVKWDSEPAALTIRVLDDGPGIKPEVRSRLFEPLFSTKAFGTGLGLTLTRAVVEAHGGNFDVTEGLDGRGAGFTIRIPNYLGAMPTGDPV